MSGLVALYPDLKDVNQAGNAGEYAMRVFARASNQMIVAIADWSSLPVTNRTAFTLAQKLSISTANEQTANQAVSNVLNAVVAESIKVGAEAVWKNARNITAITNAIPSFKDIPEEKSILYMLALRIANAIDVKKESCRLFRMDNSELEKGLCLEGLQSMKLAAEKVRDFLDINTGTLSEAASSATSVVKETASGTAKLFVPSAENLVWLMEKVAVIQTFTPPLVRNVATSAVSYGLWALMPRWKKPTGDHATKKTNGVREPPSYPSFANVDFLAQTGKDAPVVRPTETPEPAGETATQDAVAAAIGVLLDTLPIPAELTDARIAEIRRAGVDMDLLVQMNAALRDMQTGKPSVLPPPMVDRAIIAYVLEPAALTTAVAVAFGVRSENVVEAMGIAIDFLLLYGIFLSTPMLGFREETQ
jgi:hypothetical protein